MGDGKKEASGRLYVPKTPAARERQLAKMARRQERMQRELAAMKKRSAAIAAAVRADREKVREQRKLGAGGVLLGEIEEKRARVQGGDAGARQKLDYLIGLVDRAITDPGERKLFADLLDDAADGGAEKPAPPAAAPAARAEPAEKTPGTVWIWRDSLGVHAKTPGPSDRFRAGMRSLGGKWNRNRGYWDAPADQYDQVVALAEDCYEEVRLEQPPTG